MPDVVGGDPASLFAALRAAPESFEFFHALRRVECAHPQHPRLGKSTKVSEDPLRLGQTPSLAFAPRALDRLEQVDGQPPRLYALFFGLFGPNAALPLHLTEYAIERQRNAKDRTLAAFADIFHHRMLSLLYRAWAESQPTVQQDRPHADRFAVYMGALIGLATPGLRERDDLPDRCKRFFAGRLLQQARNAEGLCRLLEHVFRVPVRVIEFVAEWMALPGEAYLRLGSSPQVAGMGQTATLGGHVWGAQQRFRVRLGPLDRHRFHGFLPGGEALRELVSAVRTFVGDEKAWDVQLVLKKAEVPSVRLGLAGRMGLNSWVGRHRSFEDADPVVLRPMG